MNATRGAPGGSNELSPGGALFVLAVLVLGAFAPVFSADFLILDDEQNFVFNPGFRGFSAEHLRWMFTTGHMGHWQPLTWLSFALDHALWGLDGARFHLGNVLWHLVTAAVFFGVAEQLLVLALRDVAPARIRVGSLFAALVFALHPLRAESVAWVTGRNDVIAGLFLLLAIAPWLRFARAPLAPANGRQPMLSGVLSLVAASAILFALELAPHMPVTLRAGAGGWLAGGGVCLALAVWTTPGRAGLGTRLTYAAAWLAASLSLLGKAYGVVFPLLLLVLDVWPSGRLERVRAARGGSTARAAVALLVEKLPFFASAVVCARLAVWAKSQSDMRSLAEHSALERLAQAFYGLGFYPRKMLLPTGLSPMVDLPARIDFAAPRFLVSFLAVTALTAYLVRLRRRAPAALAVWVAYAILIAPVLGFVQSGAQLVADRYSYMACLPFALGLGGLLAWAIERGASYRQAATAAAVAAVLALGCGIWIGAARWADPVALFEHGIAASESPRLMTNLAMTYNHAAERDRANREAYLSLALQWSERAVRTAEARSLLLPQYRLHRGTILYNLDRGAEAVEDLEWYASRVPDSVEGHLNLGLALQRVGPPARLVEVFQRCVELAPNLELAWRGLGAAHDAAGNVQGAKESYRRALELAPGNAAVAARLRALDTR